MSHPTPSAPDQWARLEALLHGALEQPSADRTAWISAHVRDAAERRDLEQLLEAHDRPGSLDRLADHVVRPMLSQAPRPTPLLPADAPITTALGRYRTIAPLGAGGMGIVYRAHDERLARDVALKFLPSHLSYDDAAKHRFMLEARAAAALEHPNICTVHEIGETDDGQLYIVMACYDGETLDRRIARGPLAIADAITIATDAARGLARAHVRGVVHRDVKPANIMLTIDGMVKILDFGIAKLSAAGPTRTGTIAGTLPYMSPEQACGDRVDARSDVWALGVVLYEMLAGVRPFSGDGPQGTIAAIVLQSPTPMATRRADVSPALETVLTRALAKEPDGRFADAQELLDALLAVRSLDAPVAAPLAAAVAAPMAAPPADTALRRGGERRHVVLVATGIAGYADWVERLTADALDHLSQGVEEILREVAARHGGVVNSAEADDALLLFGADTTHEDDAVRAVRAALEVHTRIALLSTPTGQRLQARTGVHAGAVVAQRQRGTGRPYRLSGPSVEVAARLAAAASANAVLATPECFRQVAPYVTSIPAAPVRLIGNDLIVPHQITGESEVHGRLAASARIGLTPYAGRLRELQMLEDRLVTAESGEGGLTVVLGDPGVGKSRLLHELRRRVDGSSARLVLGRCDAHGGTTPYLPFVDVLHELLELDPAALRVTQDDTTEGRRIAERIQALNPALMEFVPLYCALLNAGKSAYPLPRHLQGEHLKAAMLEAIAAMLTAHAAQRPTVVLLEDWHWADEASRSALTMLATIAPAHALAMVVSSRPEGSAGWASSEHQTIVHLGPLTLRASLEIVRCVLGAQDVEPTLGRVLHERTGGNPFFLEETCQALREEQRLAVRDGTAYAVGDPEAMELPQTVQGVIRARLDRLAPETRDLARVASVIGREFARGVLEDIATDIPDLSQQLERLCASGLVQQVTVLPEPVHRFKHVLAQEVAYDSLLEHQVRSLHLATGRAIEQRHAARLDEQLERLAYHYARATEWEMAIGWAVRAAERSAGLSQTADALAMLDKAESWATHLPEGVARRDLLADLLLRQERLCEPLGLRARQVAIIETLIALLAPDGAPRLREVYLRQGDVFILRRHFDAAERALGTAIRLSREAGDRVSDRNAMRSLGLLRSHEGRLEEAVAIFEQALALDVALGETKAAAGDVSSLGNLLRRLGRHADALEALEQSLEYITADDDPIKWCAVNTVIASVYRDLGDDDAALRHLEHARDVALERKLLQPVSFSLPGIAQILLARGEVEEALQTYRQAVEAGRRMRHAEGLGQVLHAMGDVLFGLARFAEALPLLEEAETVYARLEDDAAEAMLRGRLARTHEELGRFADAQQRYALLRDRAASNGDALAEALALEGIARCARQLGVRDEAIRHYEDALARATRAQDRRLELSLRNTLGLLRWEDGAFVEALRQYESALRLCRESSDRPHEALILNSMGATLHRLRRHDEAMTTLEQGVHVSRETGERRLEAQGLGALGQILLATGRAPEAITAFEASRALRPSLGDARGEGWMFEHLGRAFAAAGRPDDAMLARVAAAAIADTIGDSALAAAVAPSLQSPHPTS